MCDVSRSSFCTFVSPLLLSSLLSILLSSPPRLNPSLPSFPTRPDLTSLRTRSQRRRPYSPTRPRTDRHTPNHRGRRARHNYQGFGRVRLDRWVRSYGCSGGRPGWGSGTTGRGGSATSWRDGQTASGRFGGEGRRRRSGCWGGVDGCRSGAGQVRIFRMGCCIAIGV